MVADTPHRVLCKCHVCYLGYSSPDPGTKELEALQGPLSRAYTARNDEIKGIDAWLTIYTSGIQLQLVDKRNGMYTSVMTMFLWKQP